MKRGKLKAVPCSFRLPILHLQSGDSTNSCYGSLSGEANFRYMVMSGEKGYISIAFSTKESS